MTRITFRLTSAVLAALLAVLSIAATTAKAEDYIILSEHSNKCMDVEGGQAREGARIVMWDCHGNQNQRFTFMGDGTIRVMGLCVDAAGGKGNNGDQIVAWRCNGGPNQKWRWSSSGRNDLGNSITGINGRCIDIYRENSSNGAELKLWDCGAGKRNQAWTRGTRLGWGYVFARPNMPPAMGHTGWGYQQADGTYWAGAVDGTGWWPSRSQKDDERENFHWARQFGTESEMLEYFKWYGKGTPNAQYTHVKKLAVVDPNYSGGRSKADSYNGTGFVVLMKNCMNETYGVLRAYGVTNSKLPWPQTNWVPNMWFWNINTEQISLY